MGYLSSPIWRPTKPNLYPDSSSFCIQSCSTSSSCKEKLSVIIHTSSSSAKSHRDTKKKHQKMAAMAALQSSMTSLSLSSNSFLGQRLSPPTLYPVTVPYPTNPLTFFVFSILLCFVAFKLVVHCYMKFHHDFLLKL